MNDGFGERVTGQVSGGVFDSVPVVGNPLGGSTEDSVRMATGVAGCTTVGCWAACTSPAILLLVGPHVMSGSASITTMIH